MTAPVVTGLGVASPNGLGTEAFWAATLAGESGIQPISRYDASGYPIRLAGEISGFASEEHISSRLLPQTDHVTRLALAVSDWALADAGIRPEELPEYAMGVITASSAGGFEFGQYELQKLWSRGPRYVSGYQSFAWFYAVNTGQISLRHGIRGSSSVLVSEQAGLDAVAQSRRLIRGGMSVMMTGGIDASLCPWALTAQIPNGRLSPCNDPARAYVPFDVDACGYVPGEGGALLVIEDAGAAAERRAPQVYGEISGYAATFDPRPGSGRPSGLCRAVEQALDDAGACPEDVGVVFADAAGVPHLDDEEADTIGRIFGPYGVAVTAPKTMTGRLYSGGAALDIAAALLSLRDRVIPPTINVHRVSHDHALDLVTEARPADVSAALIIARGYGGFNSALVLRRPAVSREQQLESPGSQP